jgi:hypothetical protein
MGSINRFPGNLVTYSCIGLRAFDNKALKIIFGAKRQELTGEWRKLHN